MTSEFLWYIIPNEGRFPWEPEGRREVDLDYLKQLAINVDRLGYTGALFATDLHDVWVLGTALGERDEAPPTAPRGASRPHLADSAREDGAHLRQPVRRAPPHQRRERRQPDDASVRALRRP